MSFITSLLDQVDSCNIKYGSVELSGSRENSYKLTVHGQQWMTYSPVDKEQIEEFKSSYELAHGHCVLTGLGLGILPAMLLKNPRVTKITVFELSKDVIDFNRALNNIDPRITIIQGFAQTIRNIEADCLLLDHYEFESIEWIKNDINMIYSQNKIPLVWFWSVEDNFKQTGLELNSENFSNWFPILPRVTTEQLIRWSKAWTDILCSDVESHKRKARIKNSQTRIHNQHVHDHNQIPGSNSMCDNTCNV